MTRILRVCLAVLLLSVFVRPDASVAGQRMSDKDVERMMTNLHNDAKRFRNVFNPAIGKSTIRKTQQEKDAKTLAKTFEDQTDKMLQQFKKTKKAEPALTSVQDSATRLDKLLTDVPLGSQVGDSWNKVKNELSTVAGAFKTGS